MKLWKVKVNNWGWDSPTTYYVESKEKAEEIYHKFPAADKPTYAGDFAESNAKRLLEVYGFEDD